MNVLIINCSPVRTGATAEIAKIISSFLITQYNVKLICIDDYNFDFCKGCRSCHKTAKCIMDDDITSMMAEFEWADRFISVSPSYWADVPGQFKAFIDRCTPWCNTHEPHATIGHGKKGYSIALRTGTNMKECNRIIESIEHFYGHLEIMSKDSLGLCSIESKDDVKSRRSEINEFCNGIMNAN
jgi:multimeric flavodoxin WrbA